MEIAPKTNHTAEVAKEKEEVVKKVAEINNNANLSKIEKLKSIVSLKRNLKDKVSAKI